MTLLIVAAAATFLAFRHVPVVNAAIVAGAGAGLSVRVAWKAGGGFLARVVAASYVIVVFLAVSLYVISAARFDIETGLQLGGGFWTFASDAYAYHTIAERMVQSWTAGTEFPQYRHAEYFILTALTYLLLGVHPLNAILPNALLHSLVAIIAYLLAEHMSGAAAARASAVLVAFWPSLLLWSAQLMKDTLFLVLIFVLLYLVSEGDVSFSGSFERRAGRWLGFLAVTFLLYKLRWYVALFLALGLAAAVVVGAFRARFSRGSWLLGGLALIAMSATVWVAARIDVVRLVAPRPPAITPAAAEKPTADSRADSIFPGLPELFRDPAHELNALRKGSNRGGQTAIDADLTFRDGGDVLVYLPRGLVRLLFSPEPSEWRRSGGATGPFKALAGLEVVLMSALVVPFLVGTGVALAQGRLPAMLLAAYIALSASATALVVVNLGTLFRLRLEFLMPGMVLTGLGLEWLRAKWRSVS
jgi:hypothetical protein